MYIVILLFRAELYNILGFSPLELTIAFLETGRGLYIVYVFTSDCPQFFSTYINIVQ